MNKEEIVKMKNEEIVKMKNEAFIHALDSLYFFYKKDIGKKRFLKFFENIKSIYKEKNRI